MGPLSEAAGPLTNRQVSPGMAFFTDFVVTGTVRGADATSTPAEVTGLLGDAFVESRTGPGQLLRCYELVEVAWEQEVDGWRGLYVTVQAHRLDVPLSVDALAADGERRFGHDRSAWEVLALWLLGSCEAAGVLGRTDAVCEIVRYGLLEPDTAVRACLDAIPVSRADVATRESTPYARENLVAVNASRAAKRLTLAAGGLLPRVRDRALRAEVAAWLELRTRLM
ncbi:hypothetical protein [Streptomyces parvus]|uniref:hypothetical protein n=1 Tax=Streptomyces parvus TaxID=66428 RepID=UPI0037143F33